MNLNPDGERVQKLRSRDVQFGGNVEQYCITHRWYWTPVIYFVGRIPFAAAHNSWSFSVSHSTYLCLLIWQLRWRMASSLRTINDGNPGSLFFISDMILQHSTLSSVLRLNNVCIMYVQYGCVLRSSVSILQWKLCGMIFDKTPFRDISMAAH